MPLSDWQLGVYMIGTNLHALYTKHSQSEGAIITVVAEPYPLNLLDIHCTFKHS